MRKLFDYFVFGNIFIALCAASMVQTSYIVHDHHTNLSFITLFVAASTFLLYNFHQYAYQFEFASWSKFLTSVKEMSIEKTDAIFSVIATIIASSALFFIRSETILLLLLMAIPALLYSIPLFSKGNKKIRLRELLFFKMPLLAFVWAFSTVVIPAVNEGVAMTSPPLIFLFLSRFFFIFALCIPFEVRDIEFDRKNKTLTIPVVYGAFATRFIGVVAVLIEICIHHFLSFEKYISYNIVWALDVTSIAAMLWIIYENKLSGKYFYKFLVDGTMIIRYIILLLFCAL